MNVTLYRLLHRSARRREVYSQRKLMSKLVLWGAQVLYVLFSVSWIT